jgi:hypothetical protein
LEFAKPLEQFVGVDLRTPRAVGEIRPAIVVSAHVSLSPSTQSSRREKLRLAVLPRFVPGQRLGAHLPYLFRAEIANHGAIPVNVVKVGFRTGFFRKNHLVIQSASVPKRIEYGEYAIIEVDSEKLLAEMDKVIGKCWRKPEFLAARTLRFEVLTSGPSPIFNTKVPRELVKNFLARRSPVQKPLP